LIKKYDALVGECKLITMEADGVTPITSGSETHYESAAYIEDASADPAAALTY